VGGCSTRISSRPAQMLRLGLDEPGRRRAIDAFNRASQGGPRLDEGLLQRGGSGHRRRPAVRLLAHGLGRRWPAAEKT
jgi:hypothetical protein